MKEFSGLSGPNEEMLEPLDSLVQKENQRNGNIWTVCLPAELETNTDPSRTESVQNAATCRVVIGRRSSADVMGWCSLTESASVDENIIMNEANGLKSWSKWELGGVM